MALIAAPHTEANSYVTIDEASVYLSERLNAISAWETTSSAPNAQNTVLDGSHTAGSTTLTVQNITGSFTVGNLVQIANKTYRVRTATDDGDTTIVLTSGLADNVSDATVVYRLSASPQEAALIWATRILDRSFNWMGTKTTSANKLEWPRYGVVDVNGYDYPYDTVPEVIKQMTAELASNLLAKDTSTLPTIIGTGLKRAVLPGPLQVDVDTNNVRKLIPPYIVTQLARMGSPISGVASGLASIQLVRV